MNTPYLIRIDPASIKKNPNAGNTVYRRYFGTETEEVKVYYGCGSWHREQYRNGVLYVTESVLVPKDKYVMDCLPSGWSSSKIERQLFETIHSILPEPNYTFQYEDTEVECDNCHQKFGWRNLETVDYDYYDDEGCYYDGYNDRVCPHCKERDCCWYRFEELDQLTGLVKVGK